jgi:hypothetical protein
MYTHALALHQPTWRLGIGYNIVCFISIPNTKCSARDVGEQSVATLCFSHGPRQKKHKVDFVLQLGPTPWHYTNQLGALESDTI